MIKKESIKKIYYNVVPSHNLKGSLLYSSNKEIEIGSIVTISLRNKIILGCVIKKFKDSPKNNIKIKNIIEYDQYFHFGQKNIDFFKWVSSYNFSSMGAVLKLMLANQKKIKPIFDRFYSLSFN